MEERKSLTMKMKLARRWPRERGKGMQGRVKGKVTRGNGEGKKGWRKKEPGLTIETPGRQTAITIDTPSRAAAHHHLCLSKSHHQSGLSIHFFRWGRNGA